MELHSLRRTKAKTCPQHRKTFSTSNLSCTSTNSSTVFRRKSIYLTLPQNIEAEIDGNGKVCSMLKGGTAHRSGVIQIGDYVQVIEKDEAEELVSIRVVFGILQVEQRPTYPFVIEIGNKSQTSLGVALTDTPGNKIRISSILPGSLVDRCGYLRAGDILTSVHLNAHETVPCSPYYTSQQIAKVLLTIVQNSMSVALTVLPDSSGIRQSQSQSLSIHSPVSSYRATESDDDNLSDASNLTLRNEQFVVAARHRDRGSGHGECDENSNSGYQILSLCLWKDFLYEDWGFSLVDEESELGIDETHARGDPQELNPVWERMEKNGRSGAIVNEIRAGGSACLAGLKAGDKILKINGRDVAQLKSTILVPILASLEDTLNLVILRTT